MKKKQFLIYLVIFVGLVTISFLPKQTESRFSYRYSNCEEGAVLCNNPGETRYLSETIDKGRGAPLMYIETQQVTNVNGKEIVSNKLKINFIYSFFNIIIYALLGLFILITGKRIVSLKKS